MLSELLLRMQWLAYGTSKFSGPPWNPSAPCPTEILARPHLNSVCIERNPTGPYCRFPNMTLTHSALTHCPNVETLDVWLDYGSCTGYELDLWAFPFADGDKYPPLKSLNLDGYRFGGLMASEEDEDSSAKYRMDPADRHSWDKSDWWMRDDEWVDTKNNDMLRQWKAHGRPKTNLDMWLEAMDWSQLQELSINTDRTEMGDAILQLPQRLTSLKHLHLDSLPFIKRLEPNTLESLRWVGATKTGFLDTILLQQGQSLQSLVYRCNELSCPYWPDHINTTALQISTPRLKHLGVNLPRSGNGSWPLAHLSAIAHMPSLQSADLYFQMQVPCKQNLLVAHPPTYEGPRNSCYDTESFVTPYLNATTAASMFSTLRSENTSKNLTSVTFHTGDWSEGITSLIEPYLAHRRSVVYCTVEKGVEVCKAENEAYWERRFGWDWEWDGETWHVEPDFEDLLDAEEKNDVLLQGWIKEKMKARIERYSANRAG